ncbi:MAG: tyrosine-type recombinase/integrase [Streptosporangiaceae bacterium]
MRLDVGDVRRSARKGVLRIYGKGGKVRQVPIHAKLRPDLEQWLTERAAWPGAGTSPALFLNTKGGRLSARAAGGIVAAIAGQAALDDDPTAHVLRHTFATSLVRGGTDLVVVAELMGHARLDTTRGRQGERAQPAHHRPLSRAAQDQPMAGFARISVVPGPGPSPPGRRAGRW